MAIYGTVNPYLALANAFLQGTPMSQPRPVIAAASASAPPGGSPISATAPNPTEFAQTPQGRQALAGLNGTNMAPPVGHPTEPPPPGTHWVLQPDGTYKAEPNSPGQAPSPMIPSGPGASKAFWAAGADRAKRARENPNPYVKYASDLMMGKVPTITKTSKDSTGHTTTATSKVNPMRWGKNW